MRYHWLSPLLLELSVTLFPAQKVAGPPGVMMGTGGSALTVTGIVAEGLLLQPLAVTTTHHRWGCRRDTTDRLSRCST